MGNVEDLSERRKTRDSIELALAERDFYREQYELAKVGLQAISRLGELNVMGSSIHAVAEDLLMSLAIGEGHNPAKR